MTEIHPSFIEQQGRNSGLDRQKPARIKADSMSAIDFDGFVRLMRVRSGWSARKVSDALGCSESAVTSWRRDGAPRYIALACAALIFGLPAWRKVQS